MSICITGHNNNYALQEYLLKRHHNQMWLRRLVSAWFSQDATPFPFSVSVTARTDMEEEKK